MKRGRRQTQHDILGSDTQTQTQQRQSSVGCCMVLCEVVRYLAGLSFSELFPFAGAAIMTHTSSPRALIISKGTNRALKCQSTHLAEPIPIPTQQQQTRSLSLFSMLRVTVTKSESVRLTWPQGDFPGWGATEWGCQCGDGRGRRLSPWSPRLRPAVWSSYC